MESCFVLGLLNSFITEFDYTQYRFDLYDSKPIEGKIFRHLVDNCPNIEKITVNNRVWNDREILPRVGEQDIFLLMARWENLSFVSAKDYDIKLKHMAIKLIQEKIPKIRY